MSLSSISGRTWEQASSPAASRSAARFESDWRASGPYRRPEPRGYVPDDPADASGVLLALLRTEMYLRREAGEPLALEEYRSRYPELGDEAFVALCYEEYCLREEAGERPEVSEYRARFPEVT